MEIQEDRRFHAFQLVARVVLQSVIEIQCHIALAAQTASESAPASGKVVIDGRGDFRQRAALVVNGNDVPCFANVDTRAQIAHRHFGGLHDSKKLRVHRTGIDVEDQFGDIRSGKCDTHAQIRCPFQLHYIFAV